MPARRLVHHSLRVRCAGSTRAEALVSFLELGMIPAVTFVALKMDGRVLEGEGRSGILSTREFREGLARVKYRTVPQSVTRNHSQVANDGS